MAAPSSYDVFLCHSSKDITVAATICHTLERDGIRCWIAPRDVPAGKEWAAEIIQAIQHCRAMVVVFSADSNISRQVLREVSAAVSAGLLIIPFRIQDFTLTDSMKYLLGTLHWLDALTPPMERHIERLSNEVRELLAVTGRPALPRPVPKSPLRTWIAVGTMLTIAIGVCLTWGQVIPDAFHETVPTLTVDQLYAEFRKDECKSADAAYMDKNVRIKGEVKGDWLAVSDRATRVMLADRTSSEATLVLGPTDPPLTITGWRVKCVFPSSKLIERIGDHQKVTVRGTYRGMITRQDLIRSETAQKPSLGISTRIEGVRIEGCVLER